MALNLPQQERPVRSDSLLLSIVTEVATREGVPAEELKPQLFDIVDPDALDTLLTTGASVDAPIAVSFDYAGYRVTIDSNQTLTVE